MTVPVEIPVIEYLEDGATLSFPFPFQFNDPSHLVVRRRVPGALFVDLDPSTWSTTGAGNPAGGSVLLSTTIAGATLKIRRDTAIEQPTSYPQFQDFPAQSHEGALDRATLISQDARAIAADTVARAIMAPEGNGGLVLGAVSDGQVLAVVGGELAGVTNDPASAADSAAQAGIAKAGAQTAQALAEAAQAEAEGALESTLVAETGARDAETGAQQARDEAQASALANGFYPGARSYVPQGATGHGAITPGSGGTDGTFAVAWTGGNYAVNPAATFIVTGGVVTDFTLKGPGEYLGAAPVAPTPVFTASAGLTGAAVALITGYLVGAGEYYLTDHATDPDQVALFQNQANAAVQVDASVDWLNIAAARSYAAQVANMALNLLPDPYQELVGRDPYLDDFDHWGNANPNVLLSGSLSGAATPVVTAPSGTNIIRKWDGSKFPLIPGATLYLDFDCYTSGAGLGALINFTDASGTAAGTTQTINGTATGAGKTTISGSVVVPNGVAGGTMQLRLAGNVYKELVGSFGSYVGEPRRNYTPLSPNYTAASEIAPNLLPDPVLRDLAAPGYSTPSLYTPSDPDNPRGGGSLGVKAGVDPRLIIDIAELGLAVGDTITWRILAFFAGTTGGGAAVDFLDASGNQVVNSTSNRSPMAGGSTAVLTGAYDLHRSTKIPANSVSIRAQVSTGAGRKMLGFAVALGRSRPNWQRALTANPASYAPPAAKNAGVMLAAADRPALTDWVCLPFIGDSIPAGWDTNGILSTAQNLNNMTFGGGPRSGSSDPTYYDAPGMATAIPLVECNNAITGTTLGETPCSSSANTMKTLAMIENSIDPAKFTIFSFSAGKGGSVISNWAKGGTLYTAFLAQVAGAKALVPAGKSFSVPAIGVVLGENDQGKDGTGGTTPTYAGYYVALKQLQADLSADVKGITGQSFPVALLVHQTAFASYARAGASYRGEVARAQLDVCKNEAHIYFVSPMFHLTPSTITGNIHLAALGEMQLGYLFGRPFKELVVDGIVPRSFYPTAALAYGTKLRLFFNVPVASMAFDPTHFASLPDNGLDVFDDSGALTLGTPTIQGGNEITWTLNRALSTNPMIRGGIKYQYPPTTFTDSGGTNLRDNSSDVLTVAGVDYPMWRPCPAFQQPIQVLS